MILTFRRFFFLLSAVTLLLSFNLNAAENINQIIKRGLENCYHFRWQTAEQDFNRIITLNPDDPRGYHYISGIYLWYYLSSGNKSDLNSFLKFSDIAVDKGEKLLSKDSGNEMLNYILGNTYTYRTLGYAKSESYINAIWSSKKSEKFLKKVIEVNPSNYDAYLGLGLYNFAAAQIPSAFKWALNLAGISGDEDTGINYIRIAAEKGNFSKVEAQYYLTQLLSGVMFNFNEARELSGSLHRKYPDNILFSYALAVVHLKEKNPDSAGRLLKNIVSSKHSKFSQVISFSNFLMGDVHFRKNDFSSAADYYNRFLVMTESNDYTGIAALRLAYSYDMLNERDSAKKYYSLTSGGNSDIEDDTYAARKGNVLKKRGMYVDEKLLLQYTNMTEAGNFHNSIKNLLAFIDSTSNQKLKAEAFYYLSEAAFHRGDTEESLNYALKGTEINAGEEIWINAYCYYNAARAAKASDRTADMKKYLSKAEETNQGDYSSHLKNLIKTLKQ
jgi:tetratricopeptide (TPR) repeat protein